MLEIGKLSVNREKGGTLRRAIGNEWVWGDKEGNAERGKGKRNSFSMNS